MSEVLVTEEFLDTFEGEVMFLSQDLEELDEKLKTKEFIQEDIELLAQNLGDVKDVFLSSTYTQHIAPIFQNFSEFISLIEYKKLLNNEDSLLYLTAIIADITTYIHQYFVDRIFSDVYLFQDSLKNSIEFFQKSCECYEGECSDEDGSEIFFL